MYQWHENFWTSLKPAAAQTYTSLQNTALRWQSTVDDNQGLLAVAFGRSPELVENAVTRMVRQEGIKRFSQRRFPVSRRCFKFELRNRVNMVLA